VTDENTISLVVMMCTQWDYQDRLAPLDVLRCLATSPALAKFRSPSAGTPIQIAISAAFDGIPAGGSPNENCAMMAARTIANLFQTPEGRKLFTQNTEAAAAVSFIERVLGVGGHTAIGPYNRNLLVALTTVILNFSVLGSRHRGSIPAGLQIRLLSALAHVLQKQTDAEVIFRALVATGTLITVIGTAAPEARSLSSSITKARDSVPDPRVKQVSEECLSLLR
jgi:phospholipase A-2-activating protein